MRHHLGIRAGVRWQELDEPVDKVMRRGSVETPLQCLEDVLLHLVQLFLIVDLLADHICHKVWLDLHPRSALEGDDQADDVH